jgi:outer membrane protein OmpA-like peptidoglycan-associated protein
MAKTATAQPPKTPPKPAPRRENFLLVSLFRLLLLGVGGTLAAFVGMAIAHFSPSTAQEPPLVEIALRRTQNWFTQVKQQLPQAPQSAPVSPTASPATSPTGSPAASPTTPLSNADRTKLEQEAAAIQQRLQSIQQQLGSSGGQFNTQPMVATPVTPAVTTTENQALMVTLPSDTLFDKTQTSLRPEISVILDTVLADLQRYPGAAIQVAAHVDQQGTEAVDRALSFSQAKAVKLYLASKLPNAQWTAVGYGHSRPLAENANESDRQRNRRIEITVKP